jgi:hypothetical protein
VATATAIGPITDVQGFINECFRAWQGTDEERIMSYYADNVVLKLPGTRMKGKQTS